MESNVLRMYSSSPPPLDEDTEDDEDEFGDFSRAIPSSLSFTEVHKSSTVIQSQSTSPPDLSSGTFTSDEAPKQPAGKSPPGTPSSSTGSEWTDGGTEAPASGNVETLANGFTDSNPSDTAAASEAVKVTMSDRAVGVHRCLEEQHHSTDQCTLCTEGGSVMANGFCELHSCNVDQTESVALTPPPEGLVASTVEQDSDVLETPECFLQGPESCSNDSEPGDSRVEEGSLEESPSEEVGLEAQPAEEELSTPSGPICSSETASFCAVVSPGDLEDFGDFGGAEFTVPSEELPQGITDEEFGDPDTLCTQGFADFSQTESGTQEEGFADFITARSGDSTDEDVGDFREINMVEEDKEACAEKVDFPEFPASDSFADFCSAPLEGGLHEEEGWAAFDQQEKAQAAEGGESWAAFGEAESLDQPEEDKSEDQWHTSMALHCGSPCTTRRDSLSTLNSRLQRLFKVSFPEVGAPSIEDEILSLKALFGPQNKQSEQRDQQILATHWEPQNVWRHLQDIHDAFGLQFQWGGSHSNKELLYCLGMDTRNIVFTGQKKQPVIVPAFAASLGMLEPTKESVKPTSAAEFAQVPQGTSGSSPDPPMVCLTKGAPQSAQVDWNSNGLNIPHEGVDPELYELSTAKLETNNTTGGHVADAFTRLMSTVDKTSTFNRKLDREEHLSEEVVRVLCRLPDLSFMKARVLMFPSLLSPEVDPGLSPPLPSPSPP
ncbi:aftiphilin isoform X1 [Denticeps clupeoides]|uniref:aftiphilin isoform X1 n=1 Tax=Denticeps clupeoides TaxID=299321 RepID=UPI0010A3590C|nr:aftiphilin-like isoform X1 [Denticeps clupeoides]XP_028846023.1 aftiphilin-like isoform X1 [Denticeps clupeoides]